MKYAIFLAVTAGCYAQNISNLTTEIQRTPTADLYVQRASAYLTAGDARAALADADRALDRDALSVRALTVRAHANNKLGRFSDTVSDLTSALALAPSDASLYMARAEAYVAVGDQPRALADRLEALRLDPAVVATVERQLAAPDNPPPPAVEAKPKPAIAKQVVPAPPVLAARTPSAEDSTTAEDHYQQSKKLLDQNQHADAIAELNEAILLEPTNPILFNTRGYAYYLSKDIPAALRDYDEAIRLNPDYLNATHNRSLARKAAGDTEGSAADRQRELELGKKLGIKVR